MAGDVQKKARIDRLGEKLAAERVAAERRGGGEAPFGTDRTVEDRLRQDRADVVLGAFQVRAVLVLPDDLGAVASRRIGHHDARLTPSVHRLPQKRSGSIGIGAFLNRDLPHIPPINDGTPQPVRLTAARDHHVVDMPFVAG